MSAKQPKKREDGAFFNPRKGIWKTIPDMSDRDMRIFMGTNPGFHRRRYSEYLQHLETTARNRLPRCRSPPVTTTSEPRAQPTGTSGPETHEGPLRPEFSSVSYSEERLPYATEATVERRAATPFPSRFEPYGIRVTYPSNFYPVSSTAPVNRHERFMANLLLSARTPSNSPDLHTSPASREDVPPQLDTRNGIHPLSSSPLYHYSEGVYAAVQPSHNLPSSMNEEVSNGDGAGDYGADEDRADEDRADEDRADDDGADDDGADDDGADDDGDAHQNREADSHDMYAEDDE